MKTFYVVSKFKNGNKVYTGKIKSITRPDDNLHYSYYDTKEEAIKQNKF